MATYGSTCARPMCIPPSYADLGKAARDIFNKGFGFGLVKLDVKTKSCSGVAKVNNSSLIGVGYTQTLRPGVKLTLSALVDGKSINAGGHKLGLALELEA
ncbi:voltage dependent anion channel 2 [Phyllostomus discolor]|uniref:Non-selective voltage-gated ion channel VDAC2 n=1 Tax=Phyllostomus discolor TaxID=89673 RepID=A0A834EFA4_9CHIR|nr:voltage dependent anion channel 2 [Phyllostomus discolor]